MTATGYTIDVYCDFGGGSLSHFHATRGNFFDESKRVAWQMCRRAGWRFKMVDGQEKAMCPACVKSGVKWVDLAKPPLKRHNDGTGTGGD